MAYVLLALSQVVGLLIIPWWPLGIWIQLAGISAVAWTSSFALVGQIPLGLLFALAISAEIATLLLAGPNRKGAKPGKARNRRAAALLGAAAGAAASLLLPLIGVLASAFIGALIGSLVASFALRSSGVGAFLGETLALTFRSVAAVAIAVLSLFTIL